MNQTMTPRRAAAFLSLVLLTLASCDKRPMPEATPAAPSTTAPMPPASAASR